MVAGFGFLLVGSGLDLGLALGFCVPAFFDELISQDGGCFAL
jgi:hypothetical protein